MLNLLNVYTSVNHGLSVYGTYNVNVNVNRGFI